MGELKPTATWNLPEGPWREGEDAPALSCVFCSSPEQDHVRLDPEFLNALWTARNALVHHGSLHSTYLFPMPSILYGIGRVFDLGGQLDSYNYPRTPEQADMIALLNDWRAVGDDVHEGLVAAIAALTKWFEEHMKTEEGRAALKESLEKLEAAAR